MDEAKMSDLDPTAWRTCDTTSSLYESELYRGLLQEHKPKSTGPSWIIWFWVLLNIISTIMQFLTTPLWINNLSPLCADPFVVYQIASFMFALFFFVTVVILHFTNKNNIFDFIRKVT